MTKNTSSTLKEDVAVLKEQVSEIRYNHIPHLQISIEKVDTRVWWLLGTVILGFLVSIALTLWR